MTRSEEIRKDTKRHLEQAYRELQAAANGYDLVDTAEAAKIAAARKQVLRLLNDLDL